MPVAPPSVGGLLAWHPQPIPVFPLGCLLTAVLYGAGMYRLRRRGDRWPVGRALAFALGLGLVLEVTATGVGGYGMRLLSVHMIQHMTLSLLAPVPLLLGAPITLALCAAPGQSQPSESAGRPAYRHPPCAGAIATGTQTPRASPALTAHALGVSGA